MQYLSATPAGREPALSALFMMAPAWLQTSAGASDSFPRQTFLLMNPPMMTIPSLDELLAQSSALHSHLCPRQVLGVRMGLVAAALLGVSAPQGDKRLLAIVETDGCFSDGIAVALNCWVGRRTMRVEDFGKVAATVVDTCSERAIRIAPHPQARSAAHAYAGEARNKWEAMKLGYQRMPADQLFIWQEVCLVTPLAALISRAGIRACCDGCGEEILNERQVVQGTRILCKACAGESYYASANGSPYLAIDSSVDGDPVVRDADATAVGRALAYCD